ncbi:hypothetical protein GCM10007160_43590 [Litchfieldella qijiaojingensis]|uniref:DUF637 domain-containing protein n=1 Tax=Litchfieldella qijiaojingensis TaxID=980347 RepID=A0ABQ2ZGG1_9GAMM|nr:DUF637 domain-containing protein [Halomonas qijiaojingensis]GGY12112.1 hypothetical protein GCM10007160_43590 [Halomonas qijiaojingensis]
MAYFTAGAASGLVASGASAAGASTAAGSAWAAASAGAAAGWANVAATAALTSMASTAAVSAINNRGDLGDTLDDTFSSDSLRGAAIAAVSAGVTKGVMGDNVNSATGATTRLDLSKAGDIARFAGQRAAQSAIHAGVSTAIEGGSLSDNLEAGLEEALTHVVSGVLFHAVGDYAVDHDLSEGGPEKIALHALAGGAVAEAMGGDFKTGALAAGANEALVEHLAELVDNDPQLLVAASQITGIVAAELTDGDLSQGAAIAAYSTLYNRGRHPQEEALLAEQAAALEERLGSPQLDGVTWDDMMALVSGAQLDAQQAAQFDALLAGLESTSNANNPQYQRFLHDLQIASVAMDDLANRYAGLELTWDNGDPITAHGEPVTAFQATDAQYRDSGLFDDVDIGAQGLGTLEAIRQYGAAQATQHQGEIADIGASAPPMDEMYDRAYWNALGGAAKPDTTDVDIALTLTGAGAGARAVSQGIRNWLQARVSERVASKGISTGAENVNAGIALNRKLSALESVNRPDYLGDFLV